ncbi:DUF642 domain-containing protein [Pseudocolwellia sp. HL-MZ19]|uniref:DUF642 domain-containing protein n=1 Tax=unclassified Pseudocolwellia TaxID=2848178 RepID=UPI003CE9EE25
MSNKVLRNIVFSSILSVFCAASANANLIVNGSFEEAATGSALGGGNGWNFYDSADINGWDGSNIELWSTLGIDSFDGDNHAELNAAGGNGGDSWSISQTFATEIGQTYELFFAYSARLGSSTESDESFSVTVDDFSAVLDDHIVGEWSIFTNSFVADSDSATLTFTIIDYAKYTYGNFLDDISVVAVSNFGPAATSVPEPETLALFALSVFGLVATRRKMK